MPSPPCPNDPQARPPGHRLATTRFHSSAVFIHIWRRMAASGGNGRTPRSTREPQGPPNPVCAHQSMPVSDPLLNRNAFVRARTEAQRQGEGSGEFQLDGSNKTQRRDERMASISAHPSPLSAPSRLCGFALNLRPPGRRTHSRQDTLHLTRMPPRPVAGQEPDVSTRPIDITLNRSRRILLRRQFRPDLIESFHADRIPNKSLIVKRVADIDLNHVCAIACL